MESLIHAHAMKSILRAIAVAIFAPTLPAQTLEPLDHPDVGTEIAWASEAFAINLMADGLTTFEESGREIRFEIGTFAPGFDPWSGTPEDWLAGWIVLDSTGYDTSDRQFIQTSTLTDNTAPFEPGGEIFIWGHTGKDLAEGAEWIIVTAEGWTWPSTDAPLPTTLSMSDATASGVLIGSVNADGHHMQLHFVPEPTAAAILGLAAAGLVLRRPGRSPSPGARR